MTESVPRFASLPPSRGPGLATSDLEAHLVCGLLRFSRVSVLCGPAGSGKTTLLLSGVLPLLSRRTADSIITGADSTSFVTRFPERRRSSDPCPAELPIFFGAWNSSPADALRTRIRSAIGVTADGSSSKRSIADELRMWGDTFGVRYLVILDAFERYLALPGDDEASAEFARELVDAITTPHVPANFLISVREEAQPLLERFRARIPRLGESHLRLPARANASEHREDVAPREESWRGTSPQHDGSIDTAASLINQSSEAPCAQTEAQWAGSGAVAYETVAAPVAEEIPDRYAASVRVARNHVRPWLAIPLFGAVLLMALLWAAMPKRTADSDKSALGADEGPLPVLITEQVLAPPATALPPIRLIVDANNTTDTHVVNDLRHWVAPNAGLQLIVQADASSAPQDFSPRIALMRYEYLQALRTAKAADSLQADDVHVLMPLYTEEIYFIVRRDSPLEFIHEIAKARINVGPDASARRLTVGRLYRAMFESALPSEALTFLPDAEALKKLVDDKSVDVVVIVAAQPTKSLENLPAQISGAIKLLTLDPQNPATRRAIDVFLPVTIRQGNYGAWLHEHTRSLATMAFLVSTGTLDEDATKRLESFARALCRNLPVLRANGHPKWREVRPDFEIDVGWPYSPIAKAAFQSCAAETSATTSVVRR